VLSMDMLLRTLSRGQSFDVLSSQANVAGYRAVIEAATTLQRPMAGSSTAAGKVSSLAHLFTCSRVCVFVCRMYWSDTSVLQSLCFLTITLMRNSID
jgi:hypothetical protein